MASIINLQRIDAVPLQGNDLTFELKSWLATLTDTLNTIFDQIETAEEVLLPWVIVSTSTQSASINTGYIVTGPQATITLPSTATAGSVVSVRGEGSSGWILKAASGQVIHADGIPTSTGGTLTSTNRYDTIDVTCIVDDTQWSVNSVISSGLIVA